MCTVTRKQHTRVTLKAKKKERKRNKFSLSFFGLKIFLKGLSPYSEDVVWIFIISASISHY